MCWFRLQHFSPSQTANSLETQWRYTTCRCRPPRQKKDPLIFAVDSGEIDLMLPGILLQEIQLYGQIRAIHAKGVPERGDPGPAFLV